MCPVFVEIDQLAFGRDDPPAVRAGMLAARFVFMLEHQAGRAGARRATAGLVVRDHREREQFGNRLVGVPSDFSTRVDARHVRRASVA